MFDPSCPRIEAVLRTAMPGHDDRDSHHQTPMALGGLPIACHLTGGKASDSHNFETLLDIGPDINPRAALDDKGYDSKSNR